MQIVSMGKKKFSADYQLMFRLLKLFLFIGFISTLVVFFLFLNLTVGDLFVCLLAFMPTGWALLSVRSLSLFFSPPIYFHYAISFFVSFLYYVVHTDTWHFFLPQVPVSDPQHSDTWTLQSKPTIWLFLN